MPRRPGRTPGPGTGPAPEPLGESDAEPVSRRQLGLGDLDLVLGGGLVPGCVTLLGGPPGIGKSTLLLQIAVRVCEQGGRALYVSGEESANQTRIRGQRLDGPSEQVLFLGETDVDAIVHAAAECAPDLLCVDSVQTLYRSELASAPGSVSQIRECAGALQNLAKRTGVPTFLVGHVTKGGVLAGPRTLEHLVDAVVRFEGPRTTDYRILRCTKNRFGRVGEVAVFRMTEGGLDPVADPASAFLAGRQAGVSGSALGVPLEGTRPMVVELQALTTPTRGQTAQLLTTGYPRRRLAMLLAVMHRRLGMVARSADVFLNVAGGLRVEDPGVDLAVLAALISAEEDRAVPDEIAFIGEVGLGGEIRAVPHLDVRLREAERAGLAAVAVPATAAPRSQLRLAAVSDVGDVVRLVRSPGRE